MCVLRPALFIGWGVDFAINHLVDRSPYPQLNLGFSVLVHVAPRLLRSSADQLWVIVVDHG